MSGSDSPTFFHGQPWSSWIERIGRDKPLSDEESEAKPTSTVTRLSAEDIDLYGFCPERDTFYGVVCEICNAIVKPQALIQHMESRHPSGTTNFPPPSTPTTKAPVKTPYCKVSKLKKTQLTSAQLSSASKINHASVKRTSSSSEPQQQLQQTQQQQQQQQQQTVAATTLVVPSSNNSTSTSLTISSSPRSPLESGTSLHTTTVQTANASGSGGSGASSSPVKSPGTSGGQPRRKRLKTDRSLLKDREYDPDRHCGVWNDETGKPCTRSLTCKAHTVSLRRTVVGRSKTFDKLLAEHRAAKDIPSGTRPTKLTVTGAVLAIPSAATNSNPLTPNNSTSNIDSEAPTSPPVLSLPDTYPLPKAVDLLYRCLAPHGSTKPTKLEEEFGNEDLRSLESSLVEASASSSSSSSLAAAQSSAASTMAPISVVLPSLSPLPANAEETAIATLIPTSSVSAMPAMTPTPTATAIASIGTPLGSSSSSAPHEPPSPTSTPPPQTNSMTPSPPQPSAPLPPPPPPPPPPPLPPTPPLSVTSTSSTTTATAMIAPMIAPMVAPMVAPVIAPVIAPMIAPITTTTTTAISNNTANLEGETSIDVDPDEDPIASIYSSAFKDEKTQYSSMRSNNLLLSPISKSSYHRQLQQVSSMPSLSLFEPADQSEQRNVAQINGKRFNNGPRTSPLVTRPPAKRSKQEYHQQDYSTAVQLEATTTSTPYPNFGDIAWSNCHPEPLAVSRWLRITSSRKQYNFNIH